MIRGKRHSSYHESAPVRILRIAKQTTADAPQGITSQVFVYNGWNLCASYKLETGNWELATAYTWGTDVSGSMQGAGGVGGLLSIEEKSGTYAGIYYPLYDGNGNDKGSTIASREPACQRGKN